MSPYKKNSRDAVLLAFHEAYERPTADQIIEWVTRYPEFAEDIRAHAAVVHDWAASCEEDLIEPDEMMLERGFSNALNAMFNADAKASEAPSTAVSEGFQDILSRNGKEIYQLATELGIARAVLADLFNGWMLPPIRERLVASVDNALTITRASFNVALELALRSPRVGHAKASHISHIKQRPCDDIIRDSNMSEDRKRYWLEQD